MLTKLAWRNARRSVRDYFVYLFTMIVVTALMFAFDSMIFSDDIQELGSDAGMFAMLIILVTVFIVFLIIWLIHYMVRFMAQKRGREFGLYLLMGFQKKQVARLFLKENIMLGTGAFLVGLIPGIFLQQLLTSMIYAVLGMEYRLNFQLRWQTFAMTAGIFAGACTLALFRNHRKFRKMNIRSMMEQEQQEERRVSGNRTRGWQLFFLSVGYMILFGILMYQGRITMETVWPLTAGLLVCVYLMYTGLCAVLVSCIRKGSDRIWKGTNVFLLRQLAARIRTMRFTMGTLTVLFAAALVGISCAMMLNRFQLTQPDEKWPFDVAVYNEDPCHSFAKEEETTARFNQIKASHSYRIYQNGTTMWRDALIKTAGGVNGDMSYFRYDTFILLSDYNTLMKMLGRKEAVLDGHEYLVQIKGRLKETAGQIARQPVRIGKTAYRCAGIRTEGFEQNGHNGADYLIVVPDSAAADLSPYYSLYMADIEGDAAPGLESALYELRNVSVRDNPNDTWEEWEAQIQNQDHGFGTDVMYVKNSLIQIRSEETKSMRFSFSVMMFPLFYIGLVFLCVSLTVLSVQQLGDAGKSRKRYGILRALGLREEELRKVILRQLAVYYLCPFAAGVLLSGGICAYISSAFVAYTDVHDPVWYYFASAVLLFGGIYLIYFVITYLEFNRLRLERE